MTDRSAEPHRLAARPTRSGVSIRVARTLLVIAALGGAATSASAVTATAVSHIGGDVSPQFTHETASRFRFEGKDGVGNVTASRECAAFRGCVVDLGNAATYSVVLDLDADREEVISEKCKGVVSTVPQLSCQNGTLEVSLRVKTGLLDIRVVSDVQPLGMPIGSAQRRFEFANDPAKYWTLNDRWRDNATGAYRFPAGRHRVFAPALLRHCLPLQANPGVEFNLPANGRTAVEIRYRGTECLVQVATDVDIAGLTMTSNRGALNCEARGQSGVPAIKSVCSARFPFNEPLTISAGVPAGLEPYFTWISNRCQFSPEDRTRCSFTPMADSTIDIFTNVKMTTKAVGVPAPPEPVALAFARGASSPADGVAVKGASSVPMLQLRATAQNGTAMLGTLTLKASGDGRDDLDVAMVKLVVDANGNGAFDAGETVLAQARPSADNGEVQLLLGSAVPIAASTDLLVVADIASDVHQASAAVAGTGVMLAMGLLAWPATRRRARPQALVAAAVVVAALLVLAGCGGGGSGSAEEVVEEASPTPLPAPVLVTYRLDLTGFEATDTATPPRSLAAPVVVEGATLTVRQ